MTNREKYDQVFMDCFMVDKGVLEAGLVYNSIPKWDSVGHMGMVASLESTFDIMMETEDIIDLSSHAKGMEILTKYGISFE